MARRALGPAVMAILMSAGLMAQMPDVRQMSGIPMPSGDVAPGSVSVRLVRGELTNNIVGHPVELRAGEKTLASKTDENGRALFAGLAPGVELQAVAVVDGERVASQPFQLPPTSGIRMILVAGLPAAGSPGATAGGTPSAAPATAGGVVFGGQSRIQIEFDDDAIEVFYLFEVINTGPAPVTPASELVFDLPEGAQQAALLEGSSTQGTVRGRRVSMVGPFAPGVTPLQLAYGLAPSGAARTISQSLPVVWAVPQVIVTKVGTVSMTSPQLGSMSEMPGDPHGVIMGTGAALPAATPLTIGLAGLPTRSFTGQYVALALALLILGGGAWAVATSKGASGDAARRLELMERRDRLMTDLARLEASKRSSATGDVRYDARHNDLLIQLERVYGELDQQGGPGEPGQAA